MREVRSRRGLLTGWLAVGLAFVLAAAGVWAYLASDSTADEREAANVRDEGRLIQARWSFERAGLDLLVTGMLDGFGIQDVPAERRESAANRIRAAADDLAALAATDGPASTRAEILVGVLDDDVVSDPAGADLVGIYWAVNDVRWADEQLPAETRFDALFELGFVAALPDHMLTEALVAFADVEAYPIDSELDGLYTEVLEVVREDGGWLAEDPPTPLSFSEWFEIENAQSAFPVETTEVERLIAETDLIAFDTWMREFGESTAPPPLSIGDVLTIVDETRTDVVEVIDPVLVAELDGAISRLDSAIDGDRRLRMLAIGLGIIALAVAAFGVARLSAVRRSTRQLSDLALRDALTGVGSRHALDETVRSALTAGRFDHHVVVMIDLDRFKMVNDVYGHAAGDAVLIEVGGRLRQLVETVCDATPGARGDVVRLGGDEFLLALHAPTEISLDEVRLHLERARSEPLMLDGGDDRRDDGGGRGDDRPGVGADGAGAGAGAGLGAGGVGVGDDPEVLVPDFSIGLVDCRGQGDLDALMTAADLEAYADKERRSFSRSRGPQLDRSIHRVPPNF